MRGASESHRQQLLDGLRRFVTSVRQIAGVRQIAIMGSIATAKPDPKDVDVLVVVADDAALEALATCSRRLQGHAQSFNRGAGVSVTIGIPVWLYAANLSLAEHFCINERSEYNVDKRIVNDKFRSLIDAKGWREPQSNQGRNRPVRRANPFMQPDAVTPLMPRFALSCPVADTTAQDGPE